MSKVYDVVIIGAGPAGCTAALYCARAGFTTMVIEKTTAGGQMCLAHSIENYPGADVGIDGITLGEKMKKSAENCGAEFKTAEVKSVDFKGDFKKINLINEMVCSKTVVIATGAHHRKLGVENEEKLAGLGVSYCANCDGMLYKNKIVAVAGGGNTAVCDALYLSKICKKVYLIHRRNKLRASDVYVKRLENADNVEICFETTVEKLLYDNKLKGISVKCGKERNIDCDGLFICIGRIAETEFLKGEILLDDNGYAVAGEDTKTNIEGVFAVGDVRTKNVRQIVTATADGAVAAHFIEEFLN